MNIINQGTTTSRTLLWIVILLVFIGLALLSSASIVESQKYFQESYYFLKHQAVFGVAIGAVLMIVFSKIPYTLFDRFSLIIFLLGIVLMALVFVPGVGITIGGATRWISVGGIIFQTTEFAKLSYIVYLASWLSRRSDEVKTISQGLVPFAVLNLTFGFFLLLQPDIGTLFMVYIIGGVMFFVAGARFKHLIWAFTFGVLAFTSAILLAPYRLSRLITFLDPSRDPLGIGYQINQALITIGSGGIFGLGFGQSKQKHTLLPEPMTDSILAITAEELGFIGIMVLLLLFMVLITKGFSVALKHRDRFAQLFVVGVFIWIAGQAIMNAAAISGLIPLTGIPIPFVSYGSSSLVSIFMGLGIVININSHLKQHAKT